MKKENVACPEAKGKLTVYDVSSSWSESLQTELKNTEQKSEDKHVFKIPLTALGPGLEKKTTQAQRMFMRLNVLDLFTTPLRLCQPQLSLFRSQTAALGSGWGFLKQSTSFTPETSFPVHSPGGARCLTALFLQRGAGVIILFSVSEHKGAPRCHSTVPSCWWLNLSDVE